MEGVNGLLIIASAFSVFCQFIDKNHKGEISAAKEELKSYDVQNHNSNQVLASLRVSIDDFLAAECLRMNQYVTYMFFFLVSIILTTTVYSLTNIFIDIPYQIDETIKSSVTAAFGLTLTVLSYKIARQYSAMKKEKLKAVNDSASYIQQCKVAAAAADTQFSETV